LHRSATLAIFEAYMDHDQQAVLEFLRRLLQYLDGGGYRRCSRPQWCVPYGHEEYPCRTDLSNDNLQDHCETCWLLPFINPELRKEPVPCHFVRLSPSGMTLDYLYRYGTPAQAEEALRNWLHQRIYEVESEIRKEKYAVSNREHEVGSCPAIEDSASSS
jgi:hypothetical protein